MQVGYQQENPGLRNSFLAGAYELRTGIPQGETADSSSPDVVRAMSTEQWLDFVGISLDPKRAEGIHFTANLVTPDNGERYVIEMSNATLTSIKGFSAAKPDLTVTLNRSDLSRVMMGLSSFDDLIAAGKAKFEGNRTGFDQLRAILVPFTPDFEILPGTAPKRPSDAPKPFEVRDLMDMD